MLLTKYYSRDDIMDEDMDGVCGTYGGEMEPGITVGSLQSRCINGRMLLKHILKKRNRMGWRGPDSSGSD